jgi:outer membrane protein assembly factor BamB
LTEGSPLAIDGIVVVSAGGSPGRSLLAYRQDTGQLAWSGGSQPVNYGSPFLASLAGRRQILVFNSRKITSHDPGSGRVLWEYPWGVREPQVAAPVVVGANRVLFSSGYGVGSELLEIEPAADGSLKASRVWQSKKMKAKFANLVQREGFLYGLDDGVLACLDLKDGSQPWEKGRYGHGQGLLVRDLFLLMAENGELVLLQPSPQSPNELHRFRVFHGKTWNPIALSGDLLLARTDQEAAGLRLAVGL